MTIQILIDVKSCSSKVPCSVTGWKESSRLISVNKAMTRLAKKKQNATANLYMSVLQIAGACSSTALLTSRHDRINCESPPDGNCDTQVQQSCQSSVFLKTTLCHFTRTSSPDWEGLLHGAPWQVCRFGHLSVQPRQGSNAAESVEEAVIELAVFI